MRLINCCDHEKHFLGGLPLVEQAKRFDIVGDAGVKGTEAGPRLLPATHCLGSTEDAWCGYRVTGPGRAFLLGSVPGTPSPLGPSLLLLKQVSSNPSSSPFRVHLHTSPLKSGVLMVSGVL